VSTVVTTLHDLGFVHLDIKPDNILLARLKSADGEKCYKLGDYGLATKADGSWPIDEGDRRYCSKELMAGSRADLRAADVFSLGLTVYELASQTELPNDGPEYTCLREGKLPRLHGYSLALQDLVQVRPALRAHLFGRLC
jgi:serine/threonine protein kinase